jgi:serine/threonine protein kinase
MVRTFFYHLPQYCSIHDNNYQTHLYIYACSHISNFGSLLSFEDDLTPKSDVYSFGVVLLEILSGKLAFYDKMSWGKRDLFLVNIELAKMSPSQGFSANKRKVVRIFDAHLEGQYSEDVAMKALDLAMHCLSNEPESRPNMNEVVQVLEQL